MLRNRKRARDAGATATFLHEAALADVKERLELVNRTFTDIAIVTGQPELWQHDFPDARIVDDAEVLDLQPGSTDLVIHAMALHWANDPVGRSFRHGVQLREDGLLLAILPGGLSLHELRAALAQAESESSGGLSPQGAAHG